MQCEVLAFKPVQKGRVAIVRIVNQPAMIGELPCSPACVLEVGQVGWMKSRLVSKEGRLSVTVQLDNAQS